MDRELVKVRIKEWDEMLQEGELFNDAIQFKDNAMSFTEEMKWFSGMELNNIDLKNANIRDGCFSLDGYMFTPEMYEIVKNSKGLTNNNPRDIVAGQLIEVAISGNKDTYICVVQYNRDNQLCFSSQYCSGLITHLDDDLSIEGDLLQIVRIWDRAETETAWSLHVGNRELLWEREEPIEYRVVTAVRFGRRESFAYAADVKLELQQGDIVVVENYEDRDEEEVVKVLNANYSEIEEEALYIFPKVKRKHKI